MRMEKRILPWNLETYYGIAIQNNSSNLAATKNAALASIFPCVCSKEYYYRYCNWRKREFVRINERQSNMNMVKNCCNQTNLWLIEQWWPEKCLACKTQNQRNSMEWFGNICQRKHLLNPMYCLSVCMMLFLISILLPMQPKPWKIGINPGEQCLARNPLGDKQQIVTANCLSIDKVKRRQRLAGPKRNICQWRTFNIVNSQHLFFQGKNLSSLSKSSPKL